MAGRRGEVTQEYEGGKEGRLRGGITNQEHYKGTGEDQSAKLTPAWYEGLGLTSDWVYPGGLHCGLEMKR